MFFCAASQAIHFPLYSLGTLGRLNPPALSITFNPPSLANPVYHKRRGPSTRGTCQNDQVTLDVLQPLLCVYQRCGRAYFDAIDGANVVKLHRLSGKLSYLAYPAFDTDPHPALVRCWTQMSALSLSQLVST